MLCIQWLHVRKLFQKPIFLETVPVFGFDHFSDVTLFHQFSVLNLLSHHDGKNHFHVRYVAGGFVINKTNEVALFISNAYCYSVPEFLLKLDFPFSLILSTSRVETQNCIEKSHLKSFVKSVTGLLCELIAVPLEREKLRKRSLLEHYDGPQFPSCTGHIKAS